MGSEVCVVDTVVFGCICVFAWVRMGLLVIFMYCGVFRCGCVWFWLWLCCVVVGVSMCVCVCVCVGDFYVLWCVYVCVCVWFWLWL